MSGARAQQDQWLKQTLGYDVAIALAGRQNGAASGTASAGANHEPDGEAEEPLEKWPFSAKKKQGAGKSVDAAPPLQVPKDKVLATKLKALTKELAALRKRGFDTARMEQDGADLANSGAKAEKLADGAARTKAMDTVKARIDEAIEHAQALAKSAGDELGKKDKPTNDQKSAIYKKAIKDLYGIEIDVPADFSNTHFDKVFDMLGTLPKDHVKQLKLSKLVYTSDAKTKGGGSYFQGTIKMGDFGTAEKQENYEIDGVTLPANSFNVTTLHEVGHAVDAKERIMEGNRSKPGCGGWKKENIASVTAGFLAECKKSVRFSDGVTDDDVSEAIKTALEAGTVNRPPAIPQDDWQAFSTFLIDKCEKARAAAKPFFKSSPVVADGRAYAQSSPTNADSWWSYDPAARAATKVNNYQWRAPGEWFAEVYAISWLKKKKPPSAVDAAAAKFCWNG
jgi:hypothetical protein